MSASYLKQVLDYTYRHVARLATAILHSKYMTMDTGLAANALVVAELPSLSDFLDGTKRTFDRGTDIVWAWMSVSEVSSQQPGNDRHLRAARA